MSWWCDEMFEYEMIEFEMFEFGQSLANLHSDTFNGQLSERHLINRFKSIAMLLYLGWTIWTHRFLVETFHSDFEMMMLKQKAPTSWTNVLVTRYPATHYHSPPSSYQLINSNLIPIACQYHWQGLRRSEVCSSVNFTHALRWPFSDVGKLYPMTLTSFTRTVWVVQNPNFGLSCYALNARALGSSQ